LANCIVSQAVRDSPSLCRYLGKNKVNKRIGVILANQYGVNPEEDANHKVRVDKHHPHMVASMIASNYNLKGVVRAPSIEDGGSLNALT